MLKATEFDLKTGQSLTEYDSEASTAGQRRDKVQEIEHSYLEHWFEHHGLATPKLFVAQFYEGVETADQARLAQEGRVLFCTNGSKGYFTDPETANLIGRGDPERGIEPVYAADLNSAHNAVAYGSLMLSDGKASTVLSPQSDLPIRILVVDDERRDVGEQPLVSLETEQPWTTAQLDQLLDRMGDGTMLVGEHVMEGLVTEEDVTATLRKALGKVDPEAIEAFSSHYLQHRTLEGTDLAPTVVEKLNRKLEESLHQTVVESDQSFV